MTPKLNFQSSTCLTHRHETCPIYKALPGVKMMRDIRHRSGLIYNYKFYLYMILTGILVIIISLGAIFSEQWFPSINALLLPAWQQTQQTHPNSFMPTQTQTEPTASATITSIPTIQIQSGATQPTTLAPSLTQSTRSGNTNQVPDLTLDTPIGGEDKFVIHRAAAGETLGQYASKYNTTINAIRGVNSNLPTVLFVDQVLVIPIDIVDVTGLPTFETYQVKATGWTIQKLAEQLSIAKDPFRYYNYLPLNYVFNPGDWVLIPRQRP